MPQRSYWIWTDKNDRVELVQSAWQCTWRKRQAAFATLTTAGGQSARDYSFWVLSDSASKSTLVLSTEASLPSSSVISQGSDAGVNSSSSSLFSTTTSDGITSEEPALSFYRLSAAGFFSS